MRRESNSSVRGTAAAIWNPLVRRLRLRRGDIRSQRRRRGDIPMAEIPGRRRRRRRIVVVVTVVLLVSLIVVDRHVGPIGQADEMHRYDGRWAEVTRVIDGHTLEVAVPDGDSAVTLVRLWGVALPEGERIAAWAASEARGRAEDLVLGELVRLELEPHRMRGDFGRVLAFVYLPEPTEIMLNETLLVEGLLEADDRWGHKHVERFALLERQARFEGRGIWGDAVERGAAIVAWGWWPKGRRLDTL